MLYIELILKQEVFMKNLFILSYLICAFFGITCEQTLIADVYDPSHATITATNNYPKVGETVTFTATPYANLFYYWSMDGDSAMSLGTNQYSRQIQKAGPVNVYLVISDANGQRYFNEAYRVIGVQQPQIFASNQSPKVGEYVTFSAAELPAGYSYVWAMDGDAQWTAGNQINRQMLREGANNIYLKAVNSLGQEYFNYTSQIVVASNTPTTPTTPVRYGFVPSGNVCYQTDWGLLTMTFSHEGFQWVSGTFVQKEGDTATRVGDIKKAILAQNPPMVKTTWEESSGRHGDIEIYFGENFSTFTGKYSFGEGNPPTLEFNGKWVDCPSTRTGGGS